MRRLSVGPDKLQLQVALDDVDPYRTYPWPTEPRRLSEAAAARWRHVLERAWEVLLREQPGTAEAMQRGVASLSPTPARERFRPRSVTSGDAFGGIEASEPDDAVQLAVTLVHEFQHTKLGGLLHLTPLLTHDADESTELWYAPWRDDPRPLEGLLQGIYAFAGIAGFWHAHRRAAGAQQAMAHFEFALWRTHVATAIEQIHRHPALHTTRRRPAGHPAQPLRRVAGGTGARGATGPGPPVRRRPCRPLAHPPSAARRSGGGGDGTRLAGRGGRPARLLGG